MPRFFLPRAAVLMALSLLGLLPANAQTVTTEKSLEVADCVKVLRPDSVHLFFDSEYALSPPACAAIRRESRMDAATGSFAGEVRDYRVADDELTKKMHYANGLRDGSFIEYYSNRQVAIQGQFAHGNPSGTWQFWYADGRPWQTLEWTGLNLPQPRLRIIAFWDSTGRQQVAVGRGTWAGSTAGYFPSRYGGPVVGGYQHGKWESYSQAANDLLTIEEFKEGRLIEGQQFVGGERRAERPVKYRSKPSLEPQLVDISLNAEPLHLGLNCTQQATAAAELEARKKQEKVNVIQPVPPREIGLYQHALLVGLARFNNLTQWLPNTNGQSIIITADIDAQGRVHHVITESGVLSSAFTTLFTELGMWHPGLANGKAVPGKLKITLRMYSTQLQSIMQTNVAYPLPPSVLEKKPN